MTVPMTVPMPVPMPVVAMVLVTAVLVRVGVRVAVVLVSVAVAVVLVRVGVLVSVRVWVWVRHEGCSCHSLVDSGGGPVLLETVDRHVGLVVMYHVAYYDSPHVSQAQPEDRL
jgi:hypothetical protein